MLIFLEKGIRLALLVPLPYLCHIILKTLSIKQYMALNLTAFFFSTSPNPSYIHAVSGVSILLTMMILKQKRELGFRRTEVLCYAFAPPPVFGPLENMPRKAQRAIRSFVFGNDMVCRLSLANAYSLFRELKEVDAIEVGALR